jgi:fatty-acyl-CoA synthase
MKSTMMHYPLTIAHLLERANRYFPGVEVVSLLPDKSLHRTDLGRLTTRARALCQALLGAGLKPGDRVATLMWNHYAHFEAYLGIPAAGGVLHPLNARLHHGDLEYIVNHAEDRFLIVDSALLPRFEEVKDKVNLERVFVAALGDASVPAGYENYEDLLAQGSDALAGYPQLDEYQPSGMCYTSGTTGRPRGVVYSHRSTIIHTYDVCLAGGIRPSDVGLPIVPMFHALAWVWPYIAALVGAKTVFAGPHTDPESIIELCRAEGVTFASGVPTVWLRVLEALQAAPEQARLRPGMRLLIAGSAVPESLLRAYDALGVEVIHSWGMTEVTSCGTAAILKPYFKDLPEDERYRLRAKQGYPLGFVEARVAVEGGKPVAPDGQSIGELQVRGPYVSGSYFKMAPDAEKFTADGWLRSGDVATVDREGFIKITDRSKDLIKSGGEWISSVDLENAIMAHPDVAEAAVIAAPHPQWDERPLAFVVPKQGSTVTADDIRRFIADKFAKWWLPDDYVFIDAIPRSSTGKFSKLTLRERYQSYFTSRARG